MGKIAEYALVSEIVGDRSLTIDKLVELKSYSGDPHSLAWCNDANLASLSRFKTGTFICSNRIKELGITNGVNYIITEHPRKLFQSVLTEFFYISPQYGVISSKAIIDNNVKIGRNVSVGHNTVIEAGCDIGDNVFIGHNNVILKNTFIGDSVVIGNNNTIGGTGFGYEKDDKGVFRIIPHIGNVIIGHNVEIGNNTCIDRGVLGSTTIGENCKVDNLVHIAHNVTMGKDVMVIALSMVGGSTAIEDGAWISPSTALRDGLRIGANTTVGMGSVVTKNIPDNEIWMGNPAKYYKSKL